MKAVEMFPELAGVMCAAHKAAGTDGKGHGLDHDAEVAQIAAAVAPNSYIAILGVAAAWTHSADHFITLRGQEPTEARIRRQVLQWLKATNLTRPEKAIVVRAVLQHTGKNSGEHHPATVLLMDADRLANMGASVVGRSSAFYGIPVVSPAFLRGEPADYRNPSCVLDDLEKCREWVDHPLFGVRLPKAREMALERAAFLDAYRAQVLRQWHEIGLIEFMSQQ